MAARSFFLRQSLSSQKLSLSTPLKAAAAFACIASLGLMMFAVPARAGDTPQSLSYARIVRLSYVQGDVQIVRTDKSSKWEPAVMNMPVEQGFAVGTNEGRAEVEFEHGSMLWLAPNSVVQFTELALSDGGRITRVTVSEGVATFEASLASADTFEVATPNFSVTPAKDAEFTIGLREKTAAVSVLSGKVLVGDHGSTQQVAKGSMFVDEDAKAPKTATLRSPKANDWDKWVDARLMAERHGATTAMAGTNAPFTYGMADMADYGAWNYFPGFGYGWQPWGTMAGWAPFMDGNWMFYPTLGWTWVSAEPWGWVPYHFGGWEYSPVFGWMWFPGDYGWWTAAPVQWYGVGKHVAWAPRGVNAPHPGSVRTPVIVSTKSLGHEGRNEVFTSNQLSAKMHNVNLRAMNFGPAENGKALPAGSSMRAAVSPVVVPTSASLRVLQARFAVKSGAKIDISSLHEAAISRPGVRGVPERGFAPINAGMTPPRMPSRPPIRATFNPGFGEGRYAGERTGTMQGPATSSPGMTQGRTSMPAATSHASTSAVAPGRPR